MGKSFLTFHIAIHHCRRQHVFQHGQALQTGLSLWYDAYVPAAQHRALFITQGIEIRTVKIYAAVSGGKKSRKNMCKSRLAAPGASDDLRDRPLLQGKVRALQCIEEIRIPDVSEKSSGYPFACQFHLCVLPQQQGCFVLGNFFGRQQCCEQRRRKGYQKGTCG